jgi:hypothetical protein
LVAGAGTAAACSPAHTCWHLTRCARTLSVCRHPQVRLRPRLRLCGTLRRWSLYGGSMPRIGWAGGVGRSSARPTRLCGHLPCPLCPSSCLQVHAGHPFALQPHTMTGSCSCWLCYIGFACLCMASAPLVELWESLVVCKWRPQTMLSCVWCVMPSCCRT